MTTQTERIRRFRSLHRPGDPVILLNVWDAGSARWVADSPSPALATASHALAGALGYDDGEQAPREEVLNVLERVCWAAGDKPVSHDAERGYAQDAGGVADFVREISAAGAVGINLEDTLADGALRDEAEQCERLAAAKSALGDGFLNARCDVFLGALSGRQEDKLEVLLIRAAAYR